MMTVIHVCDKCGTHYTGDKHTCHNTKTRKAGLAMSAINITVTGNLTGDPELRFTAPGRPVVLQLAECPKCRGGGCKSCDFTGYA
jgi:hypothetical protein